MAQFIDGFVFPIPRSRLEEYRQLASAVADIWREHGALDYCRFVGEDLDLQGTRSFPNLLAATDEEAVVFGWVVFDSREARGLANQKVAADARIPEVMKASASGFDAARMAYGGFKSLVRSTDEKLE